jgi:hypothetical protein
MSPALKLALVRFTRAVVYGSLAAGIAAASSHLPELGGVVPSPQFSLPVLTALLLAADKWVRSRQA